MSEHKVGDKIDLMYGGTTLPRGTMLQVTANGVAVIATLPAPALKAGDVIDTAEKAARLPIGSVVVTVDETSATAPSIKVGEDRWVYFSDYRGAASEHCDLDLDGDEQRIVHIPASADAGAGSTAA